MIAKKSSRTTKTARKAKTKSAKTAPRASAKVKAAKAPAPAPVSPPKAVPTKPKAKAKASSQLKIPQLRAATSRDSRERRARIRRAERSGPLYAYMKAPGLENIFDVGDTVEVFCDHEKNNDRIRGWVKGIVVQVDNKMVAVQFRSNVFLTDGWMVPDRILWYPITSDQIRGTGSKKPAAKIIPEY